MQRIATASLDFINFSPDRKVPVGADMATGLANNPSVFPNSPQKAPDLLELNTSLQDGATKARTGDHTAEANLLNIEKKWDAAYRSYAKYVGSVANGDEAIIRMGGCTPTSNQSNPSQIPAGSKNVEATAGHSTIAIGCDADAAVKAYLYIAATAGVSITQDGDTIVLTVGEEKIYIQADTHRKMIFHNLVAGLKLMVSMLPLNNAGSGPLSDAHSVIPQP